MLRAISYGGGVQSTALLVMQAKRLFSVDVPLAIFANVGDDSENPATIEYVNNYAIPYCEKHEIEFITVQKEARGIGPDTILNWLGRTEKSIGIPVRMANGAPGNRSCTHQFKINPVKNELKRRGATTDEPARLALGISWDEFSRMRSDSGIPIVKHEYPLIHRKMTRDDCKTLILSSGLPLPPKSSCWFCPFRRVADWEEMAVNEPELFQKTVALETFLNERRAKIGRDNIYFSSRLRPLPIAVTGTGDEDSASCDIAGYCHS